MNLALYGIVAAVLVGSHTTAYFKGRAAVRTEMEAAHLVDVQEARRQERQAQREVNDAQFEILRQIKVSNATGRAIADSLRDRPERRVPSDTATPTQCNGATGAELSRRDGEFLAGYATDAARDANVKLAELQAYVRKFCQPPPK